MTKARWSVYTCAGTYTCMGTSAGYGHEEIDARTFAGSDVDSPKLGRSHKPVGPPARHLYSRIGQALRALRTTSSVLAHWLSTYLQPWSIVLESRPFIPSRHERTC